MGSFQAIAAMSRNRVIGCRNRIPWHLPEDFQWFKQLTTGHVVIMGRKTFESIGKPLPNRETIILSRAGYQAAGTRTMRSLEEIQSALARDPRTLFICGGADIYALALPCCAHLYLTLVAREVEGDTLFPPFEHLFSPPEEIRRTPEFQILHYRNRTAI